LNQILNNLIIGEVIYTTKNGTNYLFNGLDQNQGIKYSINKTQKILPLLTLQTALKDFNNGIEINSTWYRNFNKREYETRGCNLSVIRSLFSRFNSL
jgi:hypothetical protein